MNTIPIAQELARIDRIFSAPQEVLELPTLSELLQHASREQAWVQLLRRNGINSLAGLSILDFGCGTGSVTRRIVELGGDPENVVGVDVTRQRIETAQTKSNAMQFICIDHTIPFPDSTFDLVFAFTVFSSILDPDARVHGAQEVWRVLRPGGAIVWFDFSWNPINRDTRGVSKRELHALFPDAVIHSQSALLAPPISRVASKLGSFARSTLESIPFIRSHRIAWVQKGVA